MDDAFIMTTTNILYPAFFDGGRDQPRRLASPPASCSMCGEPLIEIEFSKGFELTCDKVGCYLFRRPQGIRLKEPKVEQEATSYHVRHDVGITSRKGADAQRQLAQLWRAK